MSPVQNLPLVDTHAHVNLEEFASDLNDLLSRSTSGRFPVVKGRQIEDPLFRPFIAGLICPSVDFATSLLSIELSQRYDFIFAGVGFHPNHTHLMGPNDWEQYKRLVLNRASESRIVALGETGLDSYWDDAPFELQREIFVRTLELGVETGLPVIIHSREANEELVSLLRDFYTNQRIAFSPGVVHSFSGTLEQADTLLELGFYLGFGGFVTYTNKKYSELWEVARRAPSNRLLLETDCPFLTPHPLRGKLERNEPLMTAFAARRLAELRDVGIVEIVNQTTTNARELFKLPELCKEPTVFSHE